MNAQEVRDLYLHGLKLLIPNHLRGPVARYMEHGRDPGMFMNLMLIGDAHGAAGCIDFENMAVLDHWKTFMTNYLPVDAYGSTLRVAHWRHMGGLEGVPDWVKDLEIAQ